MSNSILHSYKFDLKAATSLR